MEAFLESEEVFANRELVTADYLWDFVLNVFKDDVVNYAAVTERFSTYNEHVKNHSKAGSGSIISNLRDMILNAETGSMLYFMR